MRVLLALVSGLLLFSGCSSVVFDKEAVGEMKKVAVVLYTVPATIEYYDDPKDRKKSLLQIAAAVVSANNGQQAATLAQKFFIEELNRQKLGFQAISQAEMMSNSAYLKISNKWIATRQQQKAAAEKKKSGAMKALSMMSSLTGGKSKSPDGVGPKSMPEFGLAPNWWAKSALTGGGGIHIY